MVRSSTIYRSAAKWRAPIIILDGGVLKARRMLMYYSRYHGYTVLPRGTAIPDFIIRKMLSRYDNAILLTTDKDFLGADKAIVLDVNYVGNKGSRDLALKIVKLTYKMLGKTEN
ncbi:MAG: hypothetical protein DRJ32_05965 [Thermoprotei archaeon]|nr:MAG: hypothetical protein DRJ32_05965 [Thermoprotei archaeon]